MPCHVSTNGSALRVTCRRPELGPKVDWQQDCDWGGAMALNSLYIFTDSMVHLLNVSDLSACA